jgi:hypothetical protein
MFFLNTLLQRLKIQFSLFFLKRFLIIVFVLKHSVDIRELKQKLGNVFFFQTHLKLVYSQFCCYKCCVKRIGYYVINDWSRLYVQRELSHRRAGYYVISIIIYHCTSLDRGSIFFDLTFCLLCGFL